MKQEGPTSSYKCALINMMKDGSFGVGREWKLETTTLADIQKKELDLLYGEMMEFVNCKEKE